MPEVAIRWPDLIPFFAGPQMPSKTTIHTTTFVVVIMPYQSKDAVFDFSLSFTLPTPHLNQQRKLC